MRSNYKSRSERPCQNSQVFHKRYLPLRVWVGLAAEQLSEGPRPGETRQQRQRGQGPGHGQDPSQSLFVYLPINKKHKNDCGHCIIGGHRLQVTVNQTSVNSLRPRGKENRKQNQPSKPWPRKRLIFSRQLSLCILHVFMKAFTPGHGGQAHRPEVKSPQETVVIYSEIKL